jgi:Holliday junction resolvase RusA-like endonuclease
MSKQPTLAGLDPAAAAPAKPKRKGDHKRKARPIAPATVTVRDGEIVVVVPDVLGKNESHSRGQGAARSRFLTKATLNYRESVFDGLTNFRAAESSFARRAMTVIEDGAWRLEVIGVWPNENHSVGFKAPRGDADAAIPQALDALQHAGILDDDARVIEVRAWNLHRKGERWTVIRLVRVPDLAERDAAIAHLVAALPPPSAPTPVATKRKKR